MTDPDGSDESASGGEAPVARRGGSSIALLMAIVFFVAADFALVRWFWSSPDPHVVIAVTTLPMINLLLIVLPKMGRRGKSRPYWQGFAIVGWSSVILVVLVGWFAVDAFYSRLLGSGITAHSRRIPARRRRSSSPSPPSPTPHPRCWPPCSAGGFSQGIASLSSGDLEAASA